MTKKAFQPKAWNSPLQ